MPMDLSITRRQPHPLPHKPVIDGDDVEVDKPRQRVLVHGVNVGELCDGEEQHRAMGGDRTIAST